MSCAGVDWRHKLETQRGAVLATELKNNANKLAKWTAAALVSGVEIIKLGYVSRAHHRDTRSHVILGTQVRHQLCKRSIINHSIPLQQPASGPCANHF